MSNTFFPIDENNFIEDIMNDIKDLDDIDNWLDVYQSKIDDQVSNDSIEENIMIINHYAGGIYEAIQLYIDNFGEFDNTVIKFHFHSRLAFVSIYAKFKDDIEEFNLSPKNMEYDELVLFFPRNPVLHNVGTIWSNVTQLQFPMKKAYLLVSFV
jgi:hypothetical protein